MFVKVCGLRTMADIDVAVEAGADAIGFVFAERSVRRVDHDLAARLTARVPDTVLTVGVFSDVTAAEAGKIAMATGLGAVQLHGNYPAEAFAALADLPVRLIRATPLAPTTPVEVGAYGEDLLLLDSPIAGSGERWDLTTLDGTRPTGNWILAGGLTPANVRSAITTAAPWGVDVSSGVESKRGVKDPALIREFITAARSTT